MIQFVLIFHRTELSNANQDDGIGMQPGQTQHGLGLLGAAERAAALGGTLDISSRPGEGTRLVLVLPLASQAGLADNPGPS